ncbi:WxL domain-containing protein [Enterococcus faecalis]|uniref:WxL domain-containing protein n=1 Tax=Enterococcus faecalis TaxID=1351 RepID=UPI0019275CD9|nr:WxL domain-containing protein [Enterococcus faecalis]
MKRNKWQRLAAIGLCSSLLVNAFSGVTAVAETVTIESSPTAESSVKEETQASSETQETTTETSREEVTQKTEKQAEVEVEKKEDTPVKAEQKEVEAQQEVQPTPQPPVEIQNRAVGVKAGNLVSLDSQFRELSRNERNRSQLVTPEARLGLNITSKDNTPLNTSDFKLKTEMGLTRWIRTTTTSGLFVISDETMVAPNVPTETGIDIILPSQTAVIGFVYRSDLSLYYLKDPELTVPKYIDTVELKEPVDGYTYRRYFGATGIGNPPNVGDYPMNVSLVKTNGMYVINQPKAAVWPVSPAPPLAYQAEIRSSPAASTENYNVSASGFYAMQQDYALVVTHKKVTENFVDATGAKITPPTGFTQGQQTSITSNDFTYTSAKALPDTYKAGGKTYKFKGWYKGKTKPATLKTTKTPSYAVTYDDNDDLNVVYEEAVEFPEETYQFGFVNQDGQLVKPDDITITYDYSEFLTNNGTNTWNGIALNQKAITEEKLKKITMPKSSLPKNTVNGEAMINISFSLPKYYTGLSIYDKSGKIDSNYPLPPRHYYMDNQEVIGMPSDATFINWLTLAKAADNSYVFKDALTSPLPINSSFPMMRRGVTGYTYYHSLDAPVYYHLTQRKVTENFVDATGAKITPPTGFTQGQQTSITSNDFTYTSAKALPDTYKAGGKTYKFKGWYKGKTKPATLKTTKTPSYAVTYDDNDDLNVVYEEIEAFDFPAITYQFGFVDESGKRVDASTIGLTYDNWYGEVLGTNVADWKTINLEKGQVALTKNNLKEIVYPAQSLEIMSGRGSQYSAANLTFALPKYYEKMSVYNKNGTFDAAYPFPSVQNNNSTTPIVEGTNKSVSKWFELKKSGSQSFVFNQTTPAAPTDVQVPAYLREAVHNPATTATKGTYYTLDKPVYYYLTNRKVTENFVDTTGTKITAPTGFTQGNQIPMTSDTFKYTAAKALPASYSAGGKTYTFQGWYKGKTKPNTLTTSTTPTYNTTFDGNDDMTAVYKEEVPKASVTLTRTTAETVTSGGNVTWRATITNTSQAPLTTATIKKSTAWTTGLAAPTAMIVTPVGGTAKTVPVTATTWTNGVSLGTDIPVGKSATVQFTTKATGTAGQVLRAGITTSGNYSGISASATVRVKDNDQTIVTPTAEGFISVPTFNFGQIGIAGNTQQHGLKKAADYYGNGTRNPYLRIKKTQPNWSLTAQLSQPKSATDSLPTATRLLLGAAPVSSFSNYNQPTELKNTIGTTKVINLTANNTATNIVANQQFTGSNVYQLDFVFDNIKLEVPASQGMTGQQYQAAVTWNLVTGP